MFMYLWLSYFFTWGMNLKWKAYKNAGFYLLGETKDNAFHIGTAVAKNSQQWEKE